MLNMLIFAVILTVVQIVGYAIMTYVMMNVFTSPKFVKNYFKKYMKLIESFEEDEDLDL